MLKCGTEQKQNNACPTCCQLDNSEMTSNYIYKNTKIESEGLYGSALRTRTCAKLSLETVQNVQKPAPLAATAESDEALLYSNEWGMNLRRFYMVKTGFIRQKTAYYLIYSSEMKRSQMSTVRPTKCQKLRKPPRHSGLSYRAQWITITASKLNIPLI